MKSTNFLNVQIAHFTEKNLSLVHRTLDTNFWDVENKFPIFVYFSFECAKGSQTSQNGIRTRIPTFAQIENTFFPNNSQLFDITTRVLIIIN